MNWLTTLAPDWSQALAFLVDSAVKGAVVVALAGAAAWMLRRSTAAARHSVWSAAIAAQLVIPVLSAVLPTWRVPVIAQPAWIDAATPVVVSSPNGTTASVPSNTVGSEKANSSIESAQANETRKSAPVSAPATANRWNVSPIVVLAALWLLGCVAVLSRLAVGTAVVSRMAGRGHRVTDEKWLGLLHRLAVTLGIRRPLTLLRSDALGVPVTWGIVYPVVLLPEDADSWPEERRRYVLVHEMAHVKRLDAFTHLIAQLSLAIFWFNPLVWVAAQQMRRERENACDDYVLTHGTKPSEYANDLLQLVQDIDTDGHRAAAPAFAALAMARRSEFEGRMLSILNPRIRRHGLTRKGIVMGLISTLIVAAPLAAFSPFSQLQSPEIATLPDSVSMIEPDRQRTPRIDSQYVAALPESTTQRTESSGSSTRATCDRARIDEGMSTSTHITDSGKNPNALNVRFVQVKPGRCVEASVNGLVTFTEDDRKIEGMSRGARVRFREVTAGSDRDLIITSNGDQLRRDYQVNGRTADFNDDPWLASMILTLMRESAYNAPERVRRLDAQGGTARVLGEIDAIQSTGAKRNYYSAFLELGRPLSDSTLTSILTRMRREFQSSSGDLRSVLEKIPVRSVRTTQARTAFGDAMVTIESDGDKANLLMELVPTADRELLLEIMDVAITIGSNGDKSNVLRVGAATYLNPQDQRLQDAFFKVAATIGSDGDLANVLITATPFGHANSGVTEAVIRTAKGIGSDGDKANVLTYIATQRLLTTTRVKDAFTEAARTIGSDGDRARVLRAAMLDREDFRGV
jgi:beta-lactamase regulating signal transducer with metallopeptidase domain